MDMIFIAIMTDISFPAAEKAKECVKNGYYSNSHNNALAAAAAAATAVEVPAAGPGSARLLCPIVRHRAPTPEYESEQETGFADLFD